MTPAADDPDSEEFEALLWLRTQGADVDEQIGAVLDRRAVDEEHFQGLVTQLEVPTGTEVAFRWSDDPGERERRLAGAKLHRIDLAN
jgi:hypothetical protein